MLPISEGCDDETGRVAKVFIAICELRVDHTCDDILLLPVVAKLAQPLEVILTGHLCKGGVREEATEQSAASKERGEDWLNNASQYVICSSTGVSVAYW